MKLFTRHTLSYGVSSVVSSGQKQSGLGFGCMGITKAYGSPMPDEQALKLLQGVYDTGCRHFDTAEVYATDDKYNESILGEFFQTVPRDTFTVATKYWPKQDDPTLYTYEGVKAALQASLSRLQLAYVDLYYAHRVFTLEGGLAFAEAAKRLKEEGLIKEVGLSEVSGKWLKQINNVCPIDAVQQEWSLLTRGLESELVPACRELDIPIVAYSPLARNLLATKLDEAPKDWRSTLPRYSKENLEANQAIFNKVQELSAKYDCTAAQLSLAWLFHKANKLGVTVVPIPGTTKLHNVLSNVGSVKINVDDAESLILEGLADQVAGARATEGYIAVTIESQK